MTIIPQETQDYGWFYRLQVYGRVDPLASSIAASIQCHQGILMAIANEARALVERAQFERKAKRQEIVHRHQRIHGKQSRIMTSHRVLIVRDRMEGMELVWRELWHPNWDGKGKKPKVRFNNILLGKGGGTHLSQVKKDAHADEVDLLISHEMEARRLRKLWRNATRVGLSMQALAKRRLRDLEQPDAATVGG